MGRRLRKQPKRKATYDANAVHAMEPPFRALFHFGFDEIIESFTPTFFHALETEPEIHREFDAERSVSI